MTRIEKLLVVLTFIGAVATALFHAIKEMKPAPPAPALVCVLQASYDDGATWTDFFVGTPLLVRAHCR